MYYDYISKVSIDTNLSADEPILVKNSTGMEGYASVDGALTEKTLAKMKKCTTTMIDKCPKNCQTKTKMFWNKQNQVEFIHSLNKGNYFSGPDPDDNLKNPSKIWVFKKIYCCNCERSAYYHKNVMMYAKFYIVDDDIVYFYSIHIDNM